MQTFFATITVPVAARNEQEAAAVLGLLVGNQTNLGADGATRTFEALVTIEES